MVKNFGCSDSRQLLCVYELSSATLPLHTNVTTKNKSLYFYIHAFLAVCQETAVVDYTRLAFKLAIYVSHYATGTSPIKMKESRYLQTPSISMYHKEFNQTSVICLYTIKWSNSSISDNLVWHAQFSQDSLNVKQFYLTNTLDPFRYYHSGPEWTWERWQWKGTLHSPKL